MTDPISDALDVFVPAFASARPDWDAVLRAAAALDGLASADRRLSVHRGGGVWRRRKAFVVAGILAAALAAIIVATPARALVRDVLPFWNQPSAPSPTQDSFSSLDVGAPAGMAPSVRGPARSVIETQIAGKDVHLWVAPTIHGGFCFELEGSVAGCDRSRQLPIGIGMGEKQGSWVLTGDVLAADVDHVVLRYADGTSATIPVVHVSDPINASFFVYPNAGPRPSDWPFTIQAVRADGTIISSTSVPVPGPPQPRP